MGTWEVRYQLEHKSLPKWFFEDKEQLIDALLFNKTFLYDVIDDFFHQAGIENPYSAKDFKISYGKIKDGAFVIKITFPEPEREPLCYCSYLFFDRAFEKTSYFCIEKGNEDGSNQPFVCAWAEGGNSHLNYGLCSLEGDSNLRQCSAIYLREKYGEEPQE